MMRINILYGLSRALGAVSALSIALIAGGCSDTLDTKPQDSIDYKTYFRNESELKAFSNSFYSMIPEKDLYNESVDNITRSSLWENIRGGRIIPKTGGGWVWDDLRAINTLLENAHNCPSTAVREHYEAVARFFRAYFYFEKVKMYGDVPWYEFQIDYTDAAELCRPRDSRELIMGKMIEDIDWAIEHLPSEPSVYEVNRWTALGLKSRFCLFEGTFRKYHGLSYPEHGYGYYLDLAASASKKFIDEAPYRLHDAEGPEESYLKLFSSNDALSDEVILARDYSRELGIFHDAAFKTLTPMEGRHGVTKKIVDSYLMRDGSRFTDIPGHETIMFRDECTGRDPRLAQSIRTPGYHRIGSSEPLAPDFSSCTTGYQPIKYIQDIRDAADTHSQSFIDLIVMRAAEIYLNFAEALAENGRLTQECLDMSVNKIRSRVGMPPMDLVWANAHPDPYLLELGHGYPQVSGPDTGIILEIRRERTIELLGEGFRYYDMMRWKEGNNFNQKLYGMYFPGVGEYDLDGDGTLDVCIYEGEKPATTAKLTRLLRSEIKLSEGDHGYVHANSGRVGRWDESRDYLYPIPYGERALTGGALTQNPGWNDGLDF